MSIRNKLVKGLGYAGIFIVTAIEHYLIGLLTVGVPFTLVCAIWSFFCPLPQYVAENYGKLYLLVSIPVGLILFIYSLTHIHSTGISKAQSKEQKQQ